MAKSNFKKGDIIVMSSSVYHREEVRKVESVEYQEQRAYWRIEDTDGSSYTENQCRMATQKDVRDALNAQRFVRQQAEAKYKEISGWLDEITDDEFTMRKDV